MKLSQNSTKIEFYTPSNGITDNFGAATFGFVGAEDETQRKIIPFNADLNGVMICGTYQECLDNIPDGTWDAVVVLLGNKGNENWFVDTLSKKVNAPLVGGGAAINPVTGESGLITGNSDAAVFLISDDNYNFDVCFENIHKDILSEHEISYTNPRVIDKIDGVDAVTWLKEKKVELGVAETDFEHLTLSDMNGINAHLSLVDGNICSGRDVTSKMQLRYVSENDVWDRMEAFYDDEDAIVFGCAGLKGILPKKLNSKGIGLFMFGEICTSGTVSEFGNLMLSKLRIEKKQAK